MVKKTCFLSCLCLKIIIAGDDTDYFDILVKKRRHDLKKKYRRRLLQKIKDTPGAKNLYNDLKKQTDLETEFIDEFEDESDQMDEIEIDDIEEEEEGGRGEA